MIPYIVALVFVIVMVLVQVYRQPESFSATTNTVATDASANTVATDASANVIATDASGTVLTKDASGNEVRLSLSDLFGLLGPFKTKPSEPAPVKEEVAPIVATPTVASTKELEDRIAKAVSKQVKDDLMSQRSTDELYDKYAPCDLTDAEAQGREFQNNQPRPSPQPDMSEYIRKDSIPCWNCSVP